MSPSRSRPQSYVSPGQGQTTPTKNGTTNGTSSHNSNGTKHNGVNGRYTEEEDRHSNSTRNGTGPSKSAGHERRASLQERPSSAPNGIAEQDDSEIERPARRPKPLLQRAKSDFGPRGEDPDVEDEVQDWGARHGFEDHYASEEYVSQLANVS